MVYTPHDGSGPQKFEVFNFQETGGVIMGMYNTDEVCFILCIAYLAIIKYIIHVSCERTGCLIWLGIVLYFVIWKKLKFESLAWKNIDSTSLSPQRQETGIAHKYFKLCFTFDMKSAVMMDVRNFLECIWH